MNTELARAIVAEQIESAVALGVFHDGFEIVKREYPLLIVRAKSVKRDLEFYLRFDLTGYDAVPVQVRLVNADGLEIFDPFPQRADGGQWANHGPANLPRFFCMSGTRDYYTHQSHLPQMTGVSWETHRKDLPFQRLLQEFSRRFASGEMY
jgi:hypothetical protein